MSQDKNDKTGEIYTKDFYDLIDFDCILTNLNLPRIEKGKFRLPPAEKVRTNSILKRALAVESGVATPPSPTEEHPDGCKSLLRFPFTLNRRLASSGPLAVHRGEPAEEAEREEAQGLPPAQVRVHSEEYKEVARGQQSAEGRPQACQIETGAEGRGEEGAERREEGGGAEQSGTAGEEESLGCGEESRGGPEEGEGSGESGQEKRRRSSEDSDARQK